MNQKTPRHIFLIFVLIGSLFVTGAIAGGPGFVDVDTDQPDIEKALVGMITGVAQGVSSCAFKSYRIKGLCMKGLFDVGMKLEHHLPVAFVEVVKGVGDGVLFSAQTDYMTARSNVSGASAQSYEVRVWGIDDDLRKILTLGLSNCAWCRDKGARKGPPKNYTGMPEELTQTFGAISGFMQAAFGCGVEDALLTRAIDRVQQQMAESPMPLVYTSELDYAGWRRGCRDLAVAAIYSPLVFPICGLGTVPEAPEHMARTIDRSLGSKIDDAEELDKLDAIADRLGYVKDRLQRINKGGAVSMENLCIGNWGALYPRQMTSTGTSEPVGAAVAAYRALHVAWTAVKTFKFEVSIGGLLQQVYPEVEDCFEVGAYQPEVERKMAVPYEKVGSGKDTRVKFSDGRYMFIYWAPVDCCFGIKNVAICYYQYFGGDSISSLESMNLDFQSMFPEMPDVDEMLNDATGGAYGEARSTYQEIQDFREGVENDLREALGINALDAALDDFKAEMDAWADGMFDEFGDWSDESDVEESESDGG